MGERASVVDPLVDREVGNWRIVGLIGQGGMGRVYLAQQPSIGAQVAIKVLSPQAAADRTLVDRFFAEARAANLIRNEHIVNVLAMDFMSDGTPYIVMEHLPGAPLSQLIARRGPLPLSGFVRLIGEVLDALGAAHEKGIIHRDLKPDNVFVTPAGHAKVLDFGIAKLVAGPQGSGAPTQTGALLGTPAYMSPEQAMAKPVDARSDLYAIGVILYEGIAGKPPFVAPSLFELLRQHVEVPPPPLAERRPEAPPALIAVVERALEKDPARRFASAAEMASALVQAARGLPESGALSLPGVAPASVPDPFAATQDSVPPTATDPFAPTQAEPTVRRRPRGALVAVAASAALAAAVIAWQWQARTRAVSPSVATFAPDAAVASAVAATLDAAPVLTVAPAPDATPVLTVAPAPDAAVAAAVTATVTKPAPRVPTTTPARRSSPPPPAETSPAPAEDPPPPPTEAPKRRAPQARNGFAILSFVPTATKKAREIHENAGLVSIVADAVFSDGSADLAAGPVEYWFKRPDWAGAEYGECLVQVTVGEAGVQVLVGPGSGCSSYRVRSGPRCTPAQIWQRAIAEGAPDDRQAHLRFAEGTWSFGIYTTSWSFRFRDDCGR